MQRRAGLPQRDDVPLVAMVTRLDWQKGLDITGHVLHLLMNGHAGEAQCVVLGAGATGYEGMLRHMAWHHRERMTAFIGYDADLAPLIYGGSDMFLMPSLFEPCGLGQLIAMRYGSVPVVRATGGLADTVRHGVTGFTFSNYSADDFWNALQEAAVHLPGGPRELACHSAQGHDERLFVGNLGAGVSAGLRVGDGAGAGVVSVRLNRSCATAVSAVFGLCTFRTADTAVAHRMNPACQP